MIEESSPSVRTPEPETVVVIGGGTMGSGIVASVLAAGVDVALIERDRSSAQKAFAAISAVVQEMTIPESGPRPGHLTAADTLPIGEPALVIETVPEDLEVKQQVLSHASRRYPKAVLASNTSSLSIDRLSTSVIHPARFLGLHFFNPVPRSALIEVVRCKHTGAAVLAAAHRWVARLGKASIEVGDSPGLATSRLGIAIGLEAMRMLEENVATQADIDRGMVLGYRLPIGPLELSDLVGLDVRLAIAEHLTRELGPRFDPPMILRQKVADGDLGKKTGRGFYEWRGRERVPAR